MTRPLDEHAPRFIDALKTVVRRLTATTRSREVRPGRTDFHYAAASLPGETIGFRWEAAIPARDAVAPMLTHFVRSACSTAASSACRLQQRLQARRDRRPPLKVTLSWRLQPDPPASTWVTVAHGTEGRVDLEADARPRRTRGDLALPREREAPRPISATLPSATTLASSLWCCQRRPTCRSRRRWPAAPEELVISPSRRVTARSTRCTSRTRLGFCVVACFLQRTTREFGGARRRCRSNCRSALVDLVQRHRVQVVDFSRPLHDHEARALGCRGASSPPGATCRGLLARSPACVCSPVKEVERRRIPSAASACLARSAAHRTPSQRHATYRFGAQQHARTTPRPRVVAMNRRAYRWPRRLHALYAILAPATAEAAARAHATGARAACAGHRAGSSSASRRGTRRTRARWPRGSSGAPWPCTTACSATSARMDAPAPSRPRGRRSTVPLVRDPGSDARLRARPNALAAREACPLGG